MQVHVHIILCYICRSMSTDLHVLYMQVHAHIILCYICRSMSTDLHILYMQVHAHIFYSIYVGPCPQTYMYCIRRSMPTISLLQAGSMMSGPMSEIGPSLRSTLAKTESTRHYKRRSCAKCTFPRPLLLHYKVIPFASHFPVPSSLMLLYVHRDRRNY